MSKPQPVPGSSGWPTVVLKNAEAVHILAAAAIGAQMIAVTSLEDAEKDATEARRILQAMVRVMQQKMSVVELYAAMEHLADALMANGGYTAAELLAKLDASGTLQDQQVIVDDLKRRINRNAPQKRQKGV